MIQYENNPDCALQTLPLFLSFESIQSPKDFDWNREDDRIGLVRAQIIQGTQRAQMQSAIG